MEMNEDGFLEELLALRRETWEQGGGCNNNNNNNPVDDGSSDQINGYFSTSAWPFNGLDSTPPPSQQQQQQTTITTATPILLPNTNNTSYESFSSCSIVDPTTTLDCSSSFSEFYAAATAPPPPLLSAAADSTFLSPPPPPPPSYDDDEGCLDHVQGTCKAEPGGEIIPSSFNIGLCMERNSNNNNGGGCTSSNTTTRSKVKRVEGQPSKNLMAERRRRKRLNDRLSMLRSVVPKISKMDRTSILGDTIDYMKELLERINTLQEEIDVGGSNNQMNVLSIFKDAKPSDVLVRNSPKFDVERRNLDTRVEICCAGKPGLLLSTVTTLEALGLEVQQCVISCFNDFSLQASCCEEMEQRALIGSEEIKQALFRNAGYGGRCL